MRLNTERRSGRVGIAKRSRTSDVTANNRNRFVLVYKGDEEPDEKTVQSVVKAMAPAKVTQVLPKTLSVTGKAPTVFAKASRIEDWELSRASTVTMFRQEAPCW